MRNEERAFPARARPEETCGRRGAQGQAEERGSALGSTREAHRGSVAATLGSGAFGDWGAAVRKFVDACLLGAGTVIGACVYVCVWGGVGSTEMTKAVSPIRAWLGVST